MRMDDFINILDAPKCGQRFFWSAALNSSTGIAPASSERNPIPLAAMDPVKVCALVVAALSFLSLPVSAAVSLSHQDAMRIGRKIWQNECGGTVAGLTTWNAGENFASLGIGHFIWYPAGARGPFEESFPLFVRYAERHGAKLPEQLLGREGGTCPWSSRGEFLAAESSPRMRKLRIFLVDMIDFQADFMIERLHNALPKMLAAAPAEGHAKIEQQFNRVASSAQGLYALIDYVNFKGEGVWPTERYRGRGWGLLQVLEGMSGRGDGAAATHEFADSAAAVLRERVENSPPERHEDRWLPGWLSRVATYRN
jgi:hypothetical protein